VLAEGRKNAGDTPGEAGGERAAIPRRPPAVDLRPLKAAVGRLPQGHPAREVILAEPDSIAASEYVSKVDVWFRLVWLNEV
jgi:hypothetical protein